VDNYQDGVFNTTKNFRLRFPQISFFSSEELKKVVVFPSFTYLRDRNAFWE